MTETPVAIQCISDAFGVDPADAAQKTQLSIAPASLVSIFDIFLNMQQKVTKVSSCCDGLSLRIYLDARRNGIGKDGCPSCC